MQIAKKIAKDHLAEDKRYYKYLKRMEKKLERTRPKYKRRKSKRRYSNKQRAMPW